MAAARRLEVRGHALAQQLQHDQFAPNERPAQERSQATFDALVQACTWLLPRLGYAGTTTNHIAARAGVNIASLYEYFPRTRSWRRSRIELIHDTVDREKALVAVFLGQVPYTNQLDPIRDLGARLVAFSLDVRRHVGGLVCDDLDGASLHLLINLVTSTTLQIVNDPPADVSQQELLDELVRRVELWTRQD